MYLFFFKRSRYSIAAGPINRLLSLTRVKFRGNFPESPLVRPLTARSLRTENTFAAPLYIHNSRAIKSAEKKKTRACDSQELILRGSKKCSIFPPWVHAWWENGHCLRMRKQNHEISSRFMRLAIFSVIVVPNNFFFNSSTRGTN